MTLAELGERPVLVVAVSADKDARAIVAALTPAVRAIVATRYAQERALDPDTLAAACREVAAVPVDVASEIGSALARARELARGGTVLVAGSLFVVGEARIRLLDAPADPVAVTDPPAR
jgi:dihydrofolate synthase/folylpolyglutamate synthase